MIFIGLKPYFKSNYLNRESNKNKLNIQTKSNIHREYDNNNKIHREEN